MRKLLLGLLIAILLLSLVFTGPVMAVGINYYLGEEVNAADVFDTSKMIRTFLLNGEEYEDVSFVMSGSGKPRLYWYSEWMPKDKKDNLTIQIYGYSEAEMKQWREESIERGRLVFVEEAMPSMYIFPAGDIVSINGVPWQMTEYKDVILDKIAATVKQGEALGSRDTDIWAMFMDPQTNGGSHVWFGDPYLPGYRGDGFSQMENWGVDNITQYNPLNGGKPFDFDNWTWAGDPKKDEDPGEEETEEAVFPEPGIRLGAILNLGETQVTIISGGNSKTNILSAAPEILGGRTMIPLRGVIDELGYELNYNGDLNRVEIISDDQEIYLILGLNTALVNGIEVELDQPAVAKEGRTLVPLRFVGESLGFTVEYDDGKITIKN